MGQHYLSTDNACLTGFDTLRNLSRLAGKLKCEMSVAIKPYRAERGFAPLTPASAKARHYQGKSFALRQAPLWGRMTHLRVRLHGGDVCVCTAVIPDKPTGGLGVQLPTLPPAGRLKRAWNDKGQQSEDHGGG